MPTSSTNYCSELICNILIASSQAEVKTLVNTAIASQETDSIHREKIAAFIELNIDQLEALDPMTMNSTQWSNINMAKIQFAKIKRNHELMLCKT